MTDEAAEGILSPRYRAMSIGVLMSVTIVAFQSLGVGTAMPDVARELGGLGSYGWAFSAFMLASVVGSVAAGGDADRHGPLRAYLAAIAAFAAGSVLAAASWSWGALLAGRALEGLGSGALGVVTYASASRAYPPEMYGRMLALMSSAWVLPSLAGPALAGVIAETTTWRWVFVFLLPFLPVAVLLTRPGLAALGAAAGDGGSRPLSLRRAGVLAAGLAGFLAALELDSPVAAVLLAAVGGALALPALRALLPAGTLRAARGLPSGILVRGLLAVAFLGCDAFMPLALTELQGFSLTEAGIVISIASLSWSVGSFVQAGLDRRDRGAGRRLRLQVGLAVLLCGIAVTGAGLFGSGGGIVAGVGWTIAGFGIGMGYASVGALVLSQAPGGGEGAVSAGLQLIETISIALFAGLGGVLVALGIEHGSDLRGALAAIVAAAGAAAAAGLLIARRAGDAR
ncbi:MAG TPA: MFS transporter [Solirubrobacteraceae bacterium]|nr:MFS transporter [Solirubrobacteraceae bacterium]